MAVVAEDGISGGERGERERESKVGGGESGESGWSIMEYVGAGRGMVGTLLVLPPNAKHDSLS